jgi:hypothetical protein
VTRRTVLALPARRAAARPAPATALGAPASYELVQLLALAHAIERATEDGVATRTTIAHALGLTRARVTQICNLAFLAPDIQAEVIEKASQRRVTERCLRAVVAELDWGRQRAVWGRLEAT